MIDPATQNLWDQALAGFLPYGPGVLSDFGITSQNHLEALYALIKSGDIIIEQLEAARKKGPELTKMVNDCADNPHPGIVFNTAFDLLDPESQEDEDQDALWSFGTVEPDKKTPA